MRQWDKDELSSDLSDSDTDSWSSKTYSEIDLSRVFSSQAPSYETDFLNTNYDLRVRRTSAEPVLHERYYDIPGLIDQAASVTETILGSQENPTMVHDMDKIEDGSTTPAATVNGNGSSSDHQQPNVASSSNVEGTAIVQYATYVPPFYSSNNERIMKSWGFLLDGKVRENEQEPGVLEFVELYAASQGQGKKGLYFYNFCLETDPFSTQPSGGMDLTKFNKIQFQVDVNPPPINPLVVTVNSCVKSQTNELLGTTTTKTAGATYLYMYDLFVMEERYNILTVENGIAGLKFVR